MKQVEDVLLECQLGGEKVVEFGYCR